ncbi:hypothetical protein N9934_05190, partial [Desulfosarcina sp.]|nr:hypothetical protein [Desulfosarcina sp.]
MKNLYKILATVLVASFLFTCSDDDSVNYTPKVYAETPTLAFTTSNDLAADGVTVLESSFRLNFAPSGNGVAYYAVFPSGSPAPDAEALIRKSASALQKDGVSLSGNEIAIEVVGSGVEPGYSYDSYAVMTSIDGIAGSVQKATYTTPDETPPMFLGGSSVPAHLDGTGGDGVTPFLTEVTLNFSESVFYQGGDVTFTGFFDGVQVVFTADDLDASTDGSNNITFTTDAVWGINDFMIGTWAAGTFKDNVGLEVDELGGFSYYWLTRTLTLEENIELNLSGAYDYTIDDNSGTVPVVEDGKYVVTQDGDEITVLNGIATAVGVTTNEHVFRVGNDDDGDGFGFLFAAENPQASIYTAGGTQLYWHPYFNYIFTGVAGEYNFNTGEFYYWMDFADELGANGGFYLGFFAYNFTPDLTSRAAPGIISKSGKTYEDLPEDIRLEQERRNALNGQYNGSFE